MCNTAESMGDYPTIGRARNCAPPGLSDSKTRNSELRRDFAAFVNPNVSVGPRDGHEPPLSKLGVVTLPAGSAAGGGGEHPKPKEPQPPLPTNAYTAEHRHGHDTGFETCKHVNVEHHSFQGGKVTPTEPVPDPKMSRSFLLVLTASWKSYVTGWLLSKIDTIPRTSPTPLRPFACQPGSVWLSPADNSGPEVVVTAA
ncbi:hypothetical protein AK812_SmicGene25252 [Symbiodinium microadriaticum]|uniref:Uncharacterized protein n=1 Tax=Symbiodinium microadriaticum TaxID=2951 RepID=A0A1Q9DCQ4_SYMMI|nr:hypothetical protein AK812_SmicGene25252 [Symbiodinium microadriaticum]